MRRGEVLVAILNNKLDYLVAREKHWYRVPVSSVRKWLRARWPPEAVAFYQTRIFGDEAFQVNYFARVVDIRRVFRFQLFPDQPMDQKSRREYYQLILSPLERRPTPIVSKRFRRIVFIPTTWRKFALAEEINDLYDVSVLEESLWSALKRHQIPAERQEFVSVQQASFFLDFAVYCTNGNLAIETDGDKWHANPEKSAQDNVRDNALKSVGWQVIRFSETQIREQVETYCIPTVLNTINTLGGVDMGTLSPRRFESDAPDGTYQLGLFD